jgi:ABC-type Zn uptake system ZnuABC Zn-binding protein ZnuA
MTPTTSPSILRRAGLLGASLLLAGGLVACGSTDEDGAATTSANGDAPLVVVSTTQLADFARTIGGDDVEVYSLLTPNADAHDFDPSPRDLDALARATVIVRNGLELDPWLDEAVEASGTDVEVVDASEGARLLEGGHHSHDHGDEDHADEEKAEGEEHTHEEGEEHSHAEGEEHSHAEGEEHTHEDGEEHSHEGEEAAGEEAAAEEAPAEEAEGDEAEGDEEGEEHSHDGEYDPHLWFDPANAKVMASNVADAIVDAVPDADAEVREREEAYLAELDELDAWIEAELEPLENRKLVTDHEALTYYIDRYDLEFVGSVIPSFDSAAEVSAAELAELAEKIEEAGVVAIFTEQSLPPRGAETLARQTGVEVVSGEDGLYGDSLGPEGSPGETYVGMMRHNTTSIVDNLS